MAKSSFKITNIKEFDTALKRVLKENEDKQAEILTKVSMDGLRELQRSTPKDTVRAAASWNNTVDRSPSEWFQPAGKKYYALPPFKGEQSIKFYSFINLSNNIIYIVPLENGHSKQRKHFVKDTVAALTAQLTSEARKESNRKVK